MDSTLLVTHAISPFLLQFCHVSFWEFIADEAAEYLQVIVIIHGRFKSARENGNLRQVLSKDVLQNLPCVPKFIFYHR